HARKKATEGPSAEATGSEPRRLARGRMEAATDVTSEWRNEHASQSDSVRGHPAIVVFRMALGVKGQFGNRGGVPIVRAGAQENRQNQRPKIRYEGRRKDAYKQRPLGEAAGEIGAGALSYLHPSPQLPSWSRMVEAISDFPYRCRLAESVP